MPYKKLEDEVLWCPRSGQQLLASDALAQPKRDTIHPYFTTISRFGLREGPGGTENLQAECIHPPSFEEV